MMTYLTNIVSRFVSRLLPHGCY